MIPGKKLLIIFCAAALVAAGAFLYFQKAPAPEILPPEILPPEILPPEMPAPKIAFVLDDFGYNTRNLLKVFALGVPVTLSILPNLNYSTEIAEAARKRNYETILHLPLEPKEENMPLESGTIFCDMEHGAVLEILDRSIASVPGLAGISNHMGSRATEHTGLMTIIFERAKEGNLYFMDSLVTPDSVCGKLAGKIGIRYAHRSVFLDNEPDIEYIKGQIAELRDKALLNGEAVGIGHDKASTLTAINEMLPELEEAGIQFVFLSELAK